MIVPRVIAFTFFAASVAATAQPTPAPQPQKPATATNQQQKDDDKVTCRVTPVNGTSLKRVCMTKSEWKKADAQSNDVDESGMRNSRCQLGAC